jgi:HEPN domain-containing protein
MSFDERRDDCERWLRFALADLVAAEFSASNGILAPQIGCYHAQQAVEKALKAGLLWSGIEPPRRHDLDTLRVLLPQTWLVHNLHPNLSALTEWCVEARYPGDWAEATDVDARDAARQARAVWETVLTDFERHGLDVNAFR